MALPICIRLLLLMAVCFPARDDRRTQAIDAASGAASAAQSNVGLSIGAETPPDAAIHSDSATNSETASASDKAQSLRLRRSSSETAASSPTGDAHAPVRLSSSGMAWLSSGVTSLAVVLGLIGALFWMFRKAMPAARWRDGGALSVLARVATGPKQSIALVRVGRRRVLVVGFGGDRVCALADISGEDEVAELVVAQSPSRAPRGSFERDLHQAVREGAADEAVETAADEPARATMGRARSRLEALIKSLHPRTNQSTSLEPAGAAPPS